MYLCECIYVLQIRQEKPYYIADPEVDSLVMLFYNCIDLFINIIQLSEIHRNVNQQNNFRVQAFFINFFFFFRFAHVWMVGWFVVCVWRRLCGGHTFSGDLFAKPGRNIFINTLEYIVVCSVMRDNAWEVGLLNAYIYTSHS